MSKLNLTEATMLALQGKLEESKPVRHSKMARKLTKKQENIDINVDEKTAVSVMGNETIVDTEDATIIVDKKEDEFVPETSTDLPMEAPEETVEVPVDGDETIIPEDEVSVEQDDEDEAVLDAEADVDLPLGDAETEDEEDKEDEEESKKVESKKEFKFESKKLQEELTGETVEAAEKIAKEIRKVGCMNFQDIDNMAMEILGIDADTYMNDQINIDIYSCLNYEGIFNNFGDGDFYTEEYAEEHPEVLEESKKTESVEDVENIYKSSNLFKALCDEIEDITCEDGEKPTQEQIEQAVDIVINGYDSIWEDLHTALKTEIDKITGYDEETDSFKPKYETKSHRKSLGAVTEAKTVKYSSKTFKEALNKFYTSNTKTIESVELTKFDMTKDTIKMEAKLTNKDGMTTTKILEMKQVASNKNFTKYSMQEVSRLKTENKSNITMLVATNKDNVLECKYIRK